MKLRSINWPLWAGVLLSLFAFLSYPFIFVEWPITRDTPWVNLLLLVVSLVLLVIGLRRAFAPGRRLSSKVVASVVSVISVLLMGVFLFSILIFARWLPASASAPKVGQKAPEFTLTDTNGKAVALSDLLTTPVNGQVPKGVLLIFYRGYW
jgi:hypothetical protein